MSNARIPNRFLVTREQIQAINELVQESGQNLAEGFSFPSPTITDIGKFLGVDSKMELKFLSIGESLGLGDIIKKIDKIDENNKHVFSEIKVLKDEISLKVGEDYYDEKFVTLANGLGGLSKQYETTLASIKILKDSINVSVDSTDYKSLESYVNNINNNMSKKFNNQIAVLSESVNSAYSYIDVLKEQVKLGVNDFSADQSFIEGSNNYKTPEWANSFGTDSAILHNFDYTDASGWVGENTDEKPSALRFNKGQYLTIANPLFGQTESTQNFTVEAFVNARSGSNQELVDINGGIFLSNESGRPSMIMAGLPDISLISNDFLPLNSLTHIAYVFNVQSKAIAIYINGKLSDSTIVFDSMQAMSMKESLKIGIGTMCDMYILRVYDKRLSAQEIDDNMREGIVGVKYTRHNLKILLDARKVERLASKIKKLEASINILKDSIDLSVIEQSLDTLKQETTTSFNKVNESIQNVIQSSSEHESSIKLLKDSITSKVSSEQVTEIIKTNITETNNKVEEIGSDLGKLKIEQGVQTKKVEDVIIVANTNSTEIKQLEKEIISKVSSDDYTLYKSTTNDKLTNMSGTLDSHQSKISQTERAIALKVDATDVDSRFGALPVLSNNYLRNTDFSKDLYFYTLSSAGAVSISQLPGTNGKQVSVTGEYGKDKYVMQSFIPRNGLQKVYGISAVIKTSGLTSSPSNGKVGIKAEVILTNNITKVYYPILVSNGTSEFKEQKGLFKVEFTANETIVPIKQINIYIGGNDFVGSVWFSMIMAEDSVNTFWSKSLLDLQDQVESKSKYYAQESMPYSNYPNTPANSYLDTLVGDVWYDIRNTSKNTYVYTKIPQGSNFNYTWADMQIPVVYQDKIRSTENNIKDIYDQDILSPVNKDSLLREWQTIVTEKAQITLQANSYSVDVTTINAYNSSYLLFGKFLNNNVAYVEGTTPSMLSNLNTVTDMKPIGGGNALRTVAQGYYSSRGTISKAIDDKVKSIADNAKNIADSAVMSAQSANAILMDMGSDAYITAQEKTFISLEFNRIKNEYPKLRAQAISAGLLANTTPVTTYDSNYNTLVSYVNSIFTILAKAPKAPVDIALWNSNWKNYYETSLLLADKILSTSVKVVDDKVAATEKAINNKISTTVSDFNTLMESTKNSITQSVEEKITDVKGEVSDSRLLNNMSSKTNLVKVDQWKYNSNVNALPIVGFTATNTLQNSILPEVGPYYMPSLCWKSSDAAGSGSQGGFMSDDIVIDPTKKYRYMIFAKTKVKTKDGAPGSIAFGCKPAGTATVAKLKASDNLNVVDPYFYVGRLPRVDEWFVLVGYIYPYNYTGTAGEGRIYSMDGSEVPISETNKLPIPVVDMKHASATPCKQNIRTYLYNVLTKSDVDMFFYGPSMEICNGSEIPLEAMFPKLEKDISGSKAEIKILADSITQSVKSTKTEIIKMIDDIDIGGRNLWSQNNIVAHGSDLITTNINYNNIPTFRNTVKYPNVGNNFGFRINNIISLVSEATKLTLSFYYKINKFMSDTSDEMNGYIQFVKNDDTTFRVYFNNIPKFSNSVNQGVWKKYENTIDGMFAFKAIDFLYFYGDRITIGDMYFTAPKLEKGTKATDWTPAPEDVEKNIEDSKTKAIADSKGYTNGQLAPVIVRVTNNESGIKILKDSINLKVSQTEIEEMFNPELRTLTTSNPVTTLDNATDGIMQVDSIKGITLQNLYLAETNTNGSIAQGYFYKANVSKIIDLSNKTLTFINPTNKKLTFDVRNLDGTNSRPNYVDANSSIKVVLGADKKFSNITGLPSNGWTEANKSEINGIVLEGDHTSNPPSFFEGIKSTGELEGNKIEVLSRGKNLININNIEPLSKKEDSSVTVAGNTVTITAKYCGFVVIETEKNTDYYLSAIRGTGGGGTIIIYGVSVSPENTIKGLGIGNGSFNTGNNSKITIVMYSGNGTLNTQVFTNPLLIKGETTTTYEPYKEDKSEILLKEPLRGLPNGVRDEIIGDKLIKRISKIALNGSENWTLEQNYPTKIGLYLLMVNKSSKTRKTINTINSNMADITVLEVVENNSLEGIAHDSNYSVLRLSILKSRLVTPDLAGFKKWIAENPIEVYCELAEPIITPIAMRSTLESFNGGSLLISSAISPTVTVKYPTTLGAGLRAIADASLNAEKSRLELNTNVDSINSAIANMADDNILSKTDKSQIRKEWEIIIDEYPKMLSQASKYSISTVQYTNAYSTLSSYITPLLSNMESDTPIDGAMFRNKFKTYYEQKIIVNNLLLDKAKADAINVASEDAKTKSAKALADSITYTGGQIAPIVIRVTNNESGIEILKKSINLKVTQEEVEEKIQAIDIGGRNLLKESNNIVFGNSDYPLNTTRELGKITIISDSLFNCYAVCHNNFSVPITTLCEIVGATYTFSMDVRTTNLIKDGIVFEAEFRTNIEDTIFLRRGVVKPNLNGSWQRVTGTFKTTVTTSTKSIFVITSNGVQGFNGVVIEYKNIKLEKGNKATGWTPAPEDVEKSIEDSKALAISEANKVTEKAKVDLNASINIINGTIANMSNDNILSKIDKSQIKKEWEIIVTEYPKLLAQANKYSISVTAYTNSYNALNTYIAPLLANMTVDTPIDGTVFRSNFKNYYNEKLIVNNILLDKAKADAIGSAEVDAKNKADKAFADSKTYTNGQVTTLDTKVTSKVGDVLITLDSITSRVGKTESATTTIDGKVNTLSTRVANAEQKITPEGIVATVTASTAYKNDIGSKAETTALTATESKVTQLAGLISQSVTKGEFGTYRSQTANDLAQRVTKGEFGTYFKQNADSFEFKFDYGGGRNYYGVSTPVFGLSGPCSITRKDNGGMRIIGAPAGKVGSFRISKCITENGLWTVSFRAVTNGVFDMVVDVCDGPSKVIRISNTPGYYSLVFDVKTARSGCDFVDFADVPWVTFDMWEIMIEKGSVASDWCPPTGELNNTSVSITDADGLVVKNNAISVISKSGRTAFKVDNDGYIMNEWGVSTRVKPGTTISVAGKTMADDKCTTLLRAFGLWHESVDDKYNLRIGSKTEIWFKNLADDWQDTKCKWSYASQFRTTYNNGSGAIMRDNCLDSGTGRLWLNYAGGSPGNISTTLVGDGMGAGSYGNLHCGSFYSHGSKNRVVSTVNFGDRALGAYETPTPYFGDISLSPYQIENGQCIVPIDPIFGETITDKGYQVFLSKYGPGDIWVEEMHKDFFIVKGANIKFSWELKAVQKGFENRRLEKVEVQKEIMQ